VELGGLATLGVVALTPEYQLSFPAGVERADVSLANGAIVDVAAGGRGDVVVTARNMTLGNKAPFMRASLHRGNGNPSGRGDRPGCNRSNDARWGKQHPRKLGERQCAGNGGDIQICARSFTVTNGANVLTLNGRQGNAGNITIETTDTITVSGFGRQFSSAIASQVSRGVGNGGNVTLTTRQLSLTNSGNVGTATFARGHAGDVRIVAETITIDGVGSTRSSGITSSVAPRAVGNGGVINIQTGLLSVTNGGRLFASTFGQGNAGDIRVNARDRVALDGSGSNRFSSAIVSQVATPGIGDGGTLQISAPTVTLTNGAQLATSTFGRGSAGDITIRAQDTVVFDGIGSNNSLSGAFSSVEARAIGNGGNLAISSEAFRLTNNAGLFASTSGRGDAGKIQVQSGIVALATGGRILSTVEPTGIGNGQEIAIQTRSLALTSNAQINASTAGDGKAGQIQVVADSLEANTGGRLLTTTTSRRDAGDIRLQVRDRLSLSGADSGLFANTAVGSSGNGGTIFVQSTALALQDAAHISVDSQGTGVGGNIGVQTDSLRLSDRATISAETQSNTGGNITLNVPELLLLRRGSTISTTAGKAQGTGDGGNLTIAAGLL
jgi:large exoprotein involved in heme utilization and adhesion